ncbi:MAG: 30S ribosomal protein S7 [Bacteroidetes bacterium]|nr:30S ribosomal protein S7 [Bacteroidota bacterium]
MPKYQTQFIPEESDPLQEKFINYIMIGGKKSTSRKILKNTFDKISAKTKKDPVKIFEKAIENIKPAMEVRPRRIGGAVYQIPIEVKPNRQLMLSFRWLIGASRSKKGSPMSDKLANELIDASNNTGSSIKKKEKLVSLKNYKLFLKMNKMLLNFSTR